MDNQDSTLHFQKILSNIKHLLGLSDIDDSKIDPETMKRIAEAARNVASASSNLYAKYGDGHDITMSENLMRSERPYQLKAKDKSKKGGLTEAGRKRYNKATGSNLKRPQPEGGSRKKSFCARNAGQIKMHGIDCRKTPEKRACLARKRWKCGSMGKTEDINKAELQHYSPHPDLKTIDPSYAGKGVDKTRNISSHPVSYFYFKGTKPETVVVDHGKNIYEVSVPDEHIYDIHADPMGHISMLKEQAKNKQVNPNVVMADEIHEKLKRHGYKGFYNSGHDTLPNVVGLYHPEKVKG